ncbi:MAG: TIGR04282 family arsenosugar biosynthesis glycosyltransferase [Saprospiraceae bacterium]|nr:TIGR04282 family arsenosugar biosynthesis glycosyltransferase [Saprospiraceae bacterium]
MKGIIVFVKNPELGKVKTRLASSMGDIKALEVYTKLLLYTKNVLLNVKDIGRYVFYSNHIDNEDIWSAELFHKKLQISGDLGQKMTSAFQEVFKECNQILIIGSDCPQLTASHIEEAFSKLESNNIVIGPSRDGGYYLLGMDTFYPSVFDNIPWSTSTVFIDTLQRIHENKLSVDFLEELSDIDYEEDWKTYGF